MAFALTSGFFGSKSKQDSKISSLDVRQANENQPSLWGRVKNIGQSLKSMKPSDIAWMGGNVAVGMAAGKIGMAAVGLTLGAAAVTSAAGVLAVGATTAVIGGLCSGFARAALTHVREQRKIDEESRIGFIQSLIQDRDARQALGKKLLIGSAVSVASFGVFQGGAAFLTSDTGQELTAKVSDKFNALARFIPSWKGFARVLTDKLPMSSAIAATPLQTVPVVPNVIVNPTPDQLPQGVKIPTMDEMRQLAKQVQPSVKGAGVPLTHSQIAERAISKASMAASQTELTNSYTLERLRQLIKDTTGVDAPDNATAADLAKQFHEPNHEAFLKGIQQQAPQLKVENLAASCDIQIQKENGSRNIITALCHKFKPDMAGNDVVVLTESNKTRILYRIAKVFNNVEVKVPTNDFMMDKVISAGGEIEDITKKALELASVAPQ